MANIYRDQQNILYVCLGDKWGTRERMALKDCLISKEVGHNVFLYCLRDSIIHIKAKEMGVDCLFHSGGISINFFKWYRLNDFVQYLTKFDIKLVHCYDLQFLWPASFYLKRRILVPLVFTFNHDIKKYYKKFWHKNLIRRIDQVFLPIKEMADGIHWHLEVPLRKFEYTGLGIKHYKDIVGEEKSSGSWFIGCAVGGHEKSVEFLRPMISAVHALNLKGVLKKRAKLIIYSEVSWENFLLKESLQNLIKEIGANHDVFLETVDSLSLACTQVDVWTGLDVREPIEDLLLVSILNKKPSVAPRNYATMELFRRCDHLGETYKSGDARELRDKIAEILLNYEVYVKSINKFHKGLMDEFGLDFYRNQLLKGYERILTKRERVASKRNIRR